MIVSHRNFSRRFAAVIVLAIAIVVGAAAPIQASDPAKRSPHGKVAKTAAKPKIELAIFPDNILLGRGDDFQTVAAVMTRPDGVTVDVTNEVKWKIADPMLAKFDGDIADQFVVRPLANGKTTLSARYRGQRVTAAVEVSNHDLHPPVSFVADVMPVLTRAGCNTGSCHGASRGKDGFRLSLFGYDPQGDYHRMTREVAFRRINLAVVEDSLLLQKATGAVAHTGGKLFSRQDDSYITLHRWLEQGAAIDPPDAMPPETVSLELLPSRAVIEGLGNQQRLIAVAHLADGSTRDVTDLAAFTSSNSGAADVDQNGIVTLAGRGETFVTARFGVHTVGSQILTLPDDLDYQPPPIDPNAGEIDRLVNEKLRLLRITPSPRCDDETFLRRVTIDICGLLPTEKEYETFLNDVSPDKRSRVIDELLHRREFSDIWAMKFSQLLMIKSSNQVSYKSAFLYANWLTEQFVDEVPLNEMVHDLIVAQGGTFEQPQTNFYDIERDTLKTSENVAQVFMGIRTQCAQCHNHPFDRWTMDDYYGFASFFSQVGRKPAEDYRQSVIFDRRSGEVKHPITGKPMPPKFLGDAVADVKNRDRREVVADWLTSGDNPFFATSLANRVWAHFMGVGNVDPVDDIRISNPPSNPALFGWLGDRLVQRDFDIKDLVREICNSEAYQRSAITNPSNQHDRRNYAHAVVRRIPAESLADCISQVTGRPDKYRGLPRGGRAVQIADGKTSSYFLDAFGRSPRTTVCEAEATTGPSLSQALHLLNGDAIHRKIEDGRQVHRWYHRDKLSAPEILSRLYVLTLSRPITAEEETSLLSDYETLGDDEQRVDFLNDVYWAVLNSREFVFNH